MKAYVKKVGARGEVVIPKSIRNEKGLETNSRLEIIPTKNGILMIPIRKKVSELAGLFGDLGVKNVDELDAITHELLAGI